MVLTLALFYPKRYGLEQGDILPDSNPCANSCNLWDANNNSLSYSVFGATDTLFMLVNAIALINCPICLTNNGYKLHEELW